MGSGSDASWSGRGSESFRARIQMDGSGLCRTAGLGHHHEDCNPRLWGWRFPALRFANWKSNDGLASCRGIRTCTALGRMKVNEPLIMFPNSNEDNNYVD